MSVSTIGDEIAIWSEYHAVEFDAEAYEALVHALRNAPDMHLRRELDAARAELAVAKRRTYYAYGGMGMLFLLVLHLLEQVVRAAASAP